MLLLAQRTSLSATSSTAGSSQATPRTAIQSSGISTSTLFRNKEQKRRNREVNSDRKRQPKWKQRWGMTPKAEKMKKRDPGCFSKIGLAKVNC